MTGAKVVNFPVEPSVVSHGLALLCPPTHIGDTFTLPDERAYLLTFVAEPRKKFWASNADARAWDRLASQLKAIDSTVVPDEEGWIAPTDATLAYAIALIEFISSNAPSLRPLATPAPDGSVAFEWWKDWRKVTAYASYDEGPQIEVFTTEGRGQEAVISHFASTEGDLLTHLRWLSAA